jgi:hypothetical protein
MDTLVSRAFRYENEALGFMQATLGAGGSIVSVVHVGDHPQPWRIFARFPDPEALLRAIENSKYEFTSEP